MIKIEWVVFVLLTGFLIYKTFKDYRQGEDYFGISKIVNIFWGIITLAYIFIWGGIFWW